MTDLVPQRTAITYAGDFMGAESFDHLYDMLCLDYDASDDEINQAARELMAQYHPDKENGDVEAYKTIGHVRDILTGESVEEPDFLDMEEYQEWREAQEFFSDDLLDERVSGLDDLMRGRFFGKRDEKRFEEALKDVDEAKGTDYHDRYTELREQRPSSEEEMIENQVEMELLRAEVRDRDVVREELREDLENRVQEKREKVEDAVSKRRTFSYSSSSRVDVEEKELTDVTVRGNIEFVDDEDDQELRKIMDAEVDGEVVNLSLLGDNSLHRENDVYVKVPEGSVTVEDPELTGVIQVAEGDVDIDINTFNTYFTAPPVVQVNAPEVDLKGGYTQEEGLYIPVNRDVDEEPEADLAVEVMDGTVTLDDGKPVEISDLDLVEKENKIEGSSNFSDIEQYMNQKDDGSYDNIF